MIRTAAMRRIVAADNFFNVSRVPICPPMSTARARRPSNCQESSMPRLSCPASPLSEFANMNKLVTAAMARTAAQRWRNKIGLRKMPPPMLTRPARSPSIPPSIPAFTCVAPELVASDNGSALEAASLKPGRHHIANPAKSNTTPRTPRNCSLGKSIRPPK